MKKYYALYNKTLDRYLTHPLLGIWFSEDLAEAEDMKKASLDYIKELQTEMIIEVKEITDDII